MGYETQLLIGMQTNQEYFDPKTKKMSSDYRYFQVYTSLDLCKAGSYKDLEPDQVGPSYFYSPCGDGNTQILDDKYGEKMIPIPIESVIKRLDEQSEKEEYRRYKWAIKTLEAMKDSANEQLHVLVFGH